MEKKIYEKKSEKGSFPDFMAGIFSNALIINKLRQIFVHWVKSIQESF